MKTRILKLLVRFKFKKIDEKLIRKWSKKDNFELLLTCFSSTNNFKYKHQILDKFEFNRSVPTDILFKLISKIPKQNVPIGIRIQDIGQQFLYKFNKKQLDRIERHFKKLDKRRIKFEHRQNYVNNKLVRSTDRMLFDKRKMARLEIVRQQLKRSMR